MNIPEFIDDEHEQFYKQHKNIADISPEHASLIFTLGLNRDCRKHFSDLYDEKEGVILPEGIKKNWQTSGSRSVTRMAFNLFTDSIPEDDDKAEKYTIRSIFDNLDEKTKYGAIMAIVNFL